MKDITLSQLELARQKAILDITAAIQTFKNTTGILNGSFQLNPSSEKTKDGDTEYFYAPSIRIEL